MTLRILWLSFNVVFMNVLELIQVYIYIKLGIFNYCDVIVGVMPSQITSLTIVNSTVHSGARHRKHQSPASLASVRWNHRWPTNSPHKWSVTRKWFPFDDVIMLGVIHAGPEPLDNNMHRTASLTATHLSRIKGIKCKNMANRICTTNN